MENENRFEVGDLVECVDAGDYDYLKEKKRYLITEASESFVGVGHQSYDFYHWRFKLIKKGTKMPIEQRINALNNGWDKEANEILIEIGGEYDLAIPISSKASDAIGIAKGRIMEGDKTNYEKTFAFDSQCSKNLAFKKALLWLAEKAGMLEKEIRVGDYVVANDTLYWKEKNGVHVSKYKNGVHRITSISRARYYYWNLTGQNCNKEDIRLATQKEIDSMPKEGDKAEVYIDGKKWEATLLRRL